MIAKIISGGQTGADRAALDVAMAHGIPHGGWIPKGRKTEKGPLPAKYQLKEMPTNSYPERTEKNVIDSDGTLIISHGNLTGGSDYTREMAQKHNKPWIHVDASKYSVDAAVEVIRAWLGGNNIRVLNVAGPRASKDPKIYGTTDTLLTRLIRTFFPKSVDEAVEVLLDGMAPEDRTFISTSRQNELSDLNISLGSLIRRRFGLWGDNAELLESCAKTSGREEISAETASAVIIRKLWKRLKGTQSLRAVK
jgi:hypothetical protein